MKSIMFAIMFVAMIALSGCTAKNEDVSQRFSMPEELKDYKVVQLRSDWGTFLYVLVKKQNEDREAIGTTMSAKIPVHTIVIDGKEYIRKE